MRSIPADEGAQDLAYHEETYRRFVKGVWLFTIHTLAILVILAFVFL